MPREFSLLGWTCSDRRRRVRGLPAHEQRFPGSTRRWPWAVSELRGEVKLRVWTPEDGGEKWFWGECGSALFASNPARLEPIGIRMGTFDEDPGVRPSVRQFVAYAAPWKPIPDDGLPRFSHSRHGSGAGDRAGKPRKFNDESLPPEGLGASRPTGEAPRDSNIDPGAMVSEDLAPRKESKRESRS